MCTRRLGPLYCDYADRYRGYQVDPPELVYSGPATAVEDEPTAIRFNVSSLSAVEVKVLRGSRVVFSRVATFRRGTGSFSFRPGAPGLLTVQLAAKEMRTGLGKRTGVGRTGRATRHLALGSAPYGASHPILYTGKGGVGKTSVAAATARRCAAAGL